MPQSKCQVCLHPERAKIEEALLVALPPYAALTRAYSERGRRLTHLRLHRHWLKHMAELRAAARADIEEALQLQPGVKVPALSLRQTQIMMRERHRLHSSPSFSNPAETSMGLQAAVAGLQGKAGYPTRDSHGRLRGGNSGNSGGKAGRSGRPLSPLGEFKALQRLFREPRAG